MKDTSKPLPRRVRDLWKMVGLGEVRATYFFMHGGRYMPDSDEGQAVSGEFGTVCVGGCSVFFVSNVNKFGTVRGARIRVRRRIRSHTVALAAHIVSAGGSV